MIEGFAVFVLWCVVAGPTLLGFMRGTLFPAPCLANLPPEYVEKVHPTHSAKGEEDMAEPSGVGAGAEAMLTEEDAQRGGGGG